MHSILRRLFGYAKHKARTVASSDAAPYHAKLALAGLLMLAETGVTLLIPWLGGRFAGSLLAGLQANVGAVLLALFVLFACQALLRFGHAYLVSVSGERIVADLRIRIYDHLQSLPLGFYHQRRRGDILALLLTATAKDFKVYYKRVEGKTPTSYTMDHSAGSYMYDPQGRLRLYNRYGSGAPALAADVKLLLKGS